MFEPDRVEAALSGPAREVLVTIAIQPRYASPKDPVIVRGEPVPVPFGRNCPVCGLHREVAG